MMIRVHVSIVLTVCILLAPCSSGALLQSDFYSSPFTGTPIFCERFHDVHWDSANKWMNGVNGALCNSTPPVSFSCCTQCIAGPGAPHCSNANIGVVTSSSAPRSSSRIQQASIAAM